MFRLQLTKAFFTILLYFPLETLSDDKDEECLKLFKSQIKPRECCNYPLRIILPEHQEKCRKSCEKLKDNTGGCCFLNCNYHKTGVVRNYEFNEDALLELYENYLHENGAGKFDQWMLTVAESIKTCVKLIPKSKTVYTCNIPEFALDVMDCVTAVNFLNCPNYENDSSECRELRKFVEKPNECGKEFNGTFIIDYRLFDVGE